MLPTNLEQLMGDACTLGERLRRERLACDKQPKAAGAIRMLEQQLAQTWVAIRLARLPAAVPLYDGSHPTWDEPSAKKGPRYELGI